MDVIGRTAELDRLKTWLHGGIPSRLAPDVAKKVLVIEGEPGIGKTTLWAEAVRQARLEGTNVLVCRPRPSDSGLPNVGLTDLLRSVPDEDFQKLSPPQRRYRAST
jgi:hypothetical protein